MKSPLFPLFNRKPCRDDAVEHVKRIRYLDLLTEAAADLTARVQGDDFVNLRIEGPETGEVHINTSGSAVKGEVGFIYLADVDNAPDGEGSSYSAGTDPAALAQLLYNVSYHHCHGKPIYQENAPDCPYDPKAFCVLSGALGYCYDTRLSDYVTEFFESR